MATAFPDIYTAVTSSSNLLPEASSLLGILSWDKGKELRRGLVESFLASNWSPSDLMLSANNASLSERSLRGFCASLRAPVMQLMNWRN